jgi:2-polyprenyl-3-methyl-5-hydroxy-6-metoxy-1,4-benzoquinol methylase
VNTNDRINDGLNWSHILFVENPLVNLPILEDQRKNSRKEVNGIVNLLRQNNIRKGSKILDFSCGIGRHSIELAKRGYKVVGYDPSRLFLEMAGKYAAEQLIQTSIFPKFYQGNPYYVSQVLLISNDCEFDAIIIMENSMGYAGSSNDSTMLRELHKIAGRNCILILETENRDWRLLNFESVSLHEFGDIVVYDKWNVNLENSEFESLSSFYEKVNGDENDLKMLLKLGTSMRLYSLHELIGLLSECGRKFLRCYDSITRLDRAKIDSGPNIVTVSRPA